jgi:hypothetical protein
MKAYINAPVAARQDKADAEAKTCHDQFKEDIKGHMEPCLEVLRSCGKRMTACQISSVACPEKSKSGPEGTEVAVNTFKGSPDKMDAIDLEANLEAMEAIVEGRELHKHLVVWHPRWVKKRIQDSVGSQ